MFRPGAFTSMLEYSCHMWIACNDCKAAWSFSLCVWMLHAHVIFCGVHHHAPWAVREAG